MYFPDVAGHVVVPRSGGKDAQSVVLIREGADAVRPLHAKEVQESRGSRL